MKYYFSFILLAICLLYGCKNADEAGKHFSWKKNVSDVKHLIHEIPMEDPIISGSNRIMLTDKYFIILDYKAIDKLIHIFDKNSYRHLASIANFGLGPNEITNMGYAYHDKESNNLLVMDHGQLRIMSYNLDSAIVDVSYVPSVKTKLNQRCFPDDFYQTGEGYIGIIILPTGNSGFNQIVGKWDMVSGNVEKMNYEHPEIEKARVGLAVSNKYDIYVTCQRLYDLITICDLNGNLKYNIYGSKWENKIRKGENQLKYWGDIEFCNDKIVASYSEKKYRDPHYWPTRLVFFDLSGNYEKTLEVGYNVVDFCYDEENNRIVMTCDDEIQFAYLDLNEI